MAIASNTRRDFLKGMGAGLAGAALSSASSYASIVGANDRVRVGVVGFSDRFRSALLPAFQLHAKEMNFEFVAVSDIWRLRREEGVAQLQQAAGKSIAAARNNEELYDRKDVDAVIVATADFQHAQHGVQADGRKARAHRPGRQAVALVVGDVDGVEHQQEVLVRR